MTQVNRAHLAGLEIYKELHGEDIDYMLREDLDKLIDEASAAPEQEAAVTALKLLENFTVAIKSGDSQAALTLAAELVGEVTHANQSRPSLVLLPKRRAKGDVAVLGHGTWNQCLSEIAKLGPLYTHVDPSEVDRLRAELVERDTRIAGWRDDAVSAGVECDVLRQKLAEAQALRWTPYLRGDSEPAPGVEVLVRYARQWPNDKVFFVTGAALHKSFDDRDDLFWFNGRGESMGGTVSHWMPIPSPDSPQSDPHHVSGEQS